METTNYFKKSVIILNYGDTLLISSSKLVRCPRIYTITELDQMVLEYFSDSDMLYIKLAEGTSTESEEIAPGVVLDFDEHNRTIGVEIEDASKFFDLSRLELKAFPLANLIISDRAPAVARHPE